MKRINIYIPIILILITACEKTITDFNVEDKPPKIVVHGAFSPDSVTRVNLSSSFSFNDPVKYIPINNGSISLYLNNALSATLDFDSSGWYSNAEVRMQEGDNYNLTIEAPGFKTASTDIQIPTKPTIVNVSYTIRDEIDAGCIGCAPMKRLFVEVTIDDPGAIENFYEIGMEFPQSTFITEEQIHTIYYEIYMECPNRIIEVEKSYGNYYKTSPDYNAYGTAFIFSDRFFNGEQYTLTLILDAYSFPYSENENMEVPLDIVLKATEKKYYTYAVNMANVQETNDNFLAEPVTVFQSVENGFGLVYGLNKLSHRIVINTEELGFTDQY